MAATDDYITDVTSRIPLNTPLRTRIALDLRATIGERVERGQPIETVLAQLGSPEALAESYLAAEPLVAATFWSRAGAKIVDFLLLVLIAATVGATAFFALREYVFWVLPFLFALIGFGFPLYGVFSEYLTDRTVGKRLLGLRVVRESGARISLGQAFVRQLPQFLQVFWIDVMFALFTDRSQRAFELLSHTRVVLVAAGEQPDGSGLDGVTPRLTTGG
jgi:uncharacterized RDD family membrane protein YckC